MDENRACKTAVFLHQQPMSEWRNIFIILRRGHDQVSMLVSTVQAESEKILIHVLKWKKVRIFVKHSSLSNTPCLDKVLVKMPIWKTLSLFGNFVVEIRWYVTLLVYELNTFGNRWSKLPKHPWAVSTGDDLVLLVDYKSNYNNRSAPLWPRHFSTYLPANWTLKLFFQSKIFTTVVLQVPSIVLCFTSLTDISSWARTMCIHA